MDANKIKRIIESVGKKLDEKFHTRVKEDGVHIIGFDGKNLKIREVEQDLNGHYHQVKNVVDTIGQFRFSISYYLRQYVTHTKGERYKICVNLNIVLTSLSLLLWSSP